MNEDVETIVFELDAETPHKWRMTESTPRDRRPVVGTLYLAKWRFPTAPREVMLRLVTIP